MVSTLGSRSAIRARFTPTQLGSPLGPISAASSRQSLTLAPPGLSGSCERSIGRNPCTSPPRLNENCTQSCCRSDGKARINDRGYCSDPTRHAAFHRSSHLRRHKRREMSRVSVRSVPREQSHRVEDHEQ